MNSVRAGAERFLSTPDRSTARPEKSQSTFANLNSQKVRFIQRCLKYSLGSHYVPGIALGAEETRTSQHPDIVQ